MTSLPQSRARLDALEAQGRTIAFWWRDDDARAPSLALDRLLALQSEAAVPLALAVIPDGLDQALASQLHGLPVSVLLHGHAHANHAPLDEKRAEFGDHRPLEAMRAELIEGRDKLCAMFGARFLPVFVPPWNRIDPELVARLPLAGLAGLSVLGRRDAVQPAPNLVQVNCHLDLIDWRQGRGFVGEARALALLIEHLEARRGGAADGDEATGVMSHHLVLDEAAWRFLERLLAHLQECDGAHWLSPKEAFSLAP